MGGSALIGGRCWLARRINGGGPQSVQLRPHPIQPANRGVAIALLQLLLGQVKRSSDRVDFAPNPSLNLRFDRVGQLALIGRGLGFAVQFVADDLNLSGSLNPQRNAAAGQPNDLN
jgi:hypothetical protein